VITLSVVVPSYGRPDALDTCLEALAAQRLAPHDVVVAVRRGDEVSAAVGARRKVRVVEVDEPGVLAAMSAGARATNGDVVCFTDDDAIPPPEWTERLASVFASSTLIGGVGGRDVLADEHGVPRDEPTTHDVGRLTWFGRHVGNHHRGQGAPRDVAFLKGVNSAYRRSALALPIGLRGSGAQAHFEVAVGRKLRRDGWRLVYDPELTVAHRPAPRLGEDQRGDPADAAVADAAYNLVVAVGGARGLARVAYAVLVGDRGAPGVARGLVAFAEGDRATSGRLGPALKGTVGGAIAVVRRDGVRYETFA
jgi:GT2 family glycosyltransferase